MRKLPVPLLPRLVRVAGTIAIAAVIFYFSLLDTVSAPPAAGPWWDKQLHLLAYAGLAVAATYATAAWRHDSIRRGVAMLLVVVAYGLAIELAQGQLAGRYYSLSDLFANVVGTTLGGLWLVAERYVQYWRVPIERAKP